MADPTPIPPNPNGDPLPVFDVNLPRYYHDFITNLQAIEQHLKAVTTLIPEQTKKFSQAVADVYQNAGPSRGAEAPPSRSGQRSGSSSLDNSVDAASLRRALAAISDGSDVTGGHTRDLGKGWRDRVNMSSGGGNLSWLHLPGAHMTPVDYLDMLSVTSANLAQKRHGSLIQTTKSQTIQAARDMGWITKDSNGREIFPDWLKQKINDEAGAATPMGAIGSGLAGASNMFANVQGGYIVGQKVKGLVHDIMKPITNANQYAYQYMGYEGGDPSFLGMRMPWSGATQAGLGQRASEMGFALQNNVTPGQAKFIYDSLMGQGWYGGQSTLDMRQTAANMMRTNPYIGGQPQYYAMMDQATRQGATSLMQFNEVMKAVPAAAHAAHTSIADTMSQMQALGSYNTTIGGTFFGGMQNAQTWQNVTGEPAAIMQQFLQNPLVQSQVFAASGLIPQMQGLASPFQQITGVMGALNMMQRAMPHLSGLSARDPITGLTTSVSGRQQQEALMSQMFPGIPADIINTFLNNRTGIMHGAMLEGAAQTYATAISGSAHAGLQGQTWRYLMGKPWSGLMGSMTDAVDSQGHKIFEDWRTYDSLHRDQHMSARKAHAMAQLQARRNVGNAGDSDILKYSSLGTIAAAAHSVGMDYFKLNPKTHDARLADKAMLDERSARDRASIAQAILRNPHAMSNGLMNLVAQDRKREMQKYIRQNTEKFGPGTAQNSGPALTISLSPAAQKMFKLNDPSGQAKAQGNAGQATININPYVNSYTGTPYANLDTAANFGNDSTFGSTFNNGYGAN